MTALSMAYFQDVTFLHSPKAADVMRQRIMAEGDYAAIGWSDEHQCWVFHTLYERENGVMVVSTKKMASEFSPLPRRPRRSLVYFVQSGSAVKIGVTEDIDKRLAALQTGTPAPICLLATIPGNKTTESQLHKRFAADHIHYEWFRLSPELLQYIGSVQ